MVRFAIFWIFLALFVLSVQATAFADHEPVKAEEPKTEEQAPEEKAASEQSPEGQMMEGEVSAEESAGEEAPKGEVHVVDIPDGENIFLPETITIKAGDVVKWVNKDTKAESHNFASVPGPKPEDKELGLIILKTGETREHTFKKPGKFLYFCYIHRGMIGTVIAE